MPRVAVAASGGRDSTALLHATTRAAAALGLEVLALHVHHGLQPAADDWQARVKLQARRWGARFDSRRLADGPIRGESIEAWARRGRYRALTEMAREAGCGLVLLAHHRRDQAETFLLQALRGSGPAGLAAMPAQAVREGIVWARPWLDHPREAIEAYVRRHRLAYVDDASNADARFARNALRARVWPALLSGFAQAEPALIAAAAQAQHAAALARDVAAADLAAATEQGALCLPAWLALSAPRRRNALAAWLGESVPAAPGSLVERLLHELPAARQGRWPACGQELRLYRGRLSLQAPSTPRLAPAATGTLDLSRPGAHRLPGFGGSVVVEPTAAHGVRAEALRHLLARARSGGERFRLSPRGAARSLKKQCQARGVPAWEREGPLLFCGDGRLLFVPGLGIDASLWAKPGEPQFRVRWVPGPSQPAK